uniref:Uncharacterized protein n=1 Tax=Solanum lycopersicum TaxID=4081 RepID=A0A3Q7I2A9_SOLLC
MYSLLKTNCRTTLTCKLEGRNKKHYNHLSFSRLWSCVGQATSIFRFKASNINPSSPEVDSTILCITAKDCLQFSNMLTARSSFSNKNTSVHSCFIGQPAGQKVPPRKWKWIKTQKEGEGEESRGISISLMEYKLCYLTNFVKKIDNNILKVEITTPKAILDYILSCAHKRTMAIPQLKKLQHNQQNGANKKVTLMGFGSTSEFIMLERISRLFRVTTRRSSIILTISSNTFSDATSENTFSQLDVQVSSKSKVSLCVTGLLDKTNFFLIAFTISVPLNSSLLIIPQIRRFKLQLGSSIVSSVASSTIFDSGVGPCRISFIFALTILLICAPPVFNRSPSDEEAIFSLSMFMIVDQMEIGAIWGFSFDNLGFSVTDIIFSYDFCSNTFLHYEIQNN